MADITVTNASQSADGTITIQGTNFTQTTTTVAVDGADTTFEFVSTSELSVDGEAGATEVTVTKNGTSQSIEIDSDAAAATDSPSDVSTGDTSQTTDQSGIDPDAPKDPRELIAAQNTNTSDNQTEDPIQSGPQSPQVDQNLEPAVPSVSYLDVDPNEVPAAEGEGTAQIVIPPLAPSGLEAAPKAITPGTWTSPIDGFRGAVAGQQLVGLIPVGDEKTPYPTGTPLGSGKRFWLQNGYYKSATPT